MTVADDKVAREARIARFDRARQACQESLGQVKSRVLMFEAIQGRIVAGERMSRKDWARIARDLRAFCLREFDSLEENLGALEVQTEILLDAGDDLTDSQD
ncbi:MAG: hypothetical protein ACYC35_05630 [Pirellulales bacterium]